MLGDLADQLAALGVHSILNPEKTRGVFGIRQRGEQHEPKWLGRKVGSVRYYECDDPLMDPIQIEKTDNGWRYQNEPLETLGYIELERISGTVSCVVELTQLCINYYSRPAELIEGWPVPIHQHPDWSVPDITRAIKNSERITQSQAVSLLDAGIAKYRCVFDQQVASGQKREAPADCYYYPVSESGEMGHFVSFKAPPFLLLRCDFERAYRCDA